MGNELSKLMVVIGANTAQFEKGMKGVTSNLQSVGKKMTMIGGAMVAGVAAIGGTSLKMASDFSGAMREVNTMMLLNEEEFKAFSKDVQNLAKDMGVDATEAANALYQAISAGVPKENVIEFLEIASKAAIGGVTDTKTAVDGLSTVLNAFKMPMADTQKVADLMFTTVKGGKTTFEELSASMSLVAPIAASLGVNFEDVMATTATLTKQGTPTAVAMTQIRAALIALMKPSADMQTLLDKLGYASGEAMLQSLGFAGSMSALRDAADGNNQVLATAFGRVEGLNAMLGVTGENMEMATADMDAMTNSAGAAIDAFEQMEQSPARQMAHLKASLQDIGITIGTALMPTLKKLLDAIMPIVEKIGDWISAHPELVKMVLIVTGAIGGLMLVLGPLFMILPGIIAALPVLGVAFAALTGPIGIVIAAIAAAIAIGVLIVKNWDKIKIAAKAFGEALIMPFKLYAMATQAAINFIIRQINKIHFTIPDWVPGLGGKAFGFNIPELSLPGLAAGGIVTSPTLAMIGEKGPEAVVPLGSRMGSTVNITVQGSVIAERDLAETIREEFLKIKGRNYSFGL